MRRIVALLAAVALAATGAAVLAPAASADDYVYCPGNDVVYPVISSVTLAPSAIVIGRANKTVTVTVKAGDDCAIDHIYVTLIPKGGSTYYPIYLTAFTRVSGSTSNGTWRSTKVVDDQQPGGLYEIYKLEVVDTNFNNTVRMSTPNTVRIRHATRTVLRKPRATRGTTVALYGRLFAYGDFGTWKVQVQQHRPGKHWSKLRTLTTNAWGDYSTKVKVTKTTYFRVVHFPTRTTVGSTSVTRKVSR